MSKYKSNQERTIDYLKKFDRNKVLKALIPSESPVVLDVGSNNGQTILQLIGLFDSPEIYSFEPQIECFQALNDLKLTHKEKKIHTFQLALSNIDSEGVDFFSHDVSSGLSGFNKLNLLSSDSIKLNELQSDPDEGIKYRSQVNHKRTVSVSRLDSWLAKNNISKVNYLKLDTQGHEAEVLEGAGQYLSNIDVITTELMFYDLYEKSLSFSDIEKFLLPAGFSLFDISHISKNPMNGRTDWVDVIYINNQYRKKLSHI